MKPIDQTLLRPNQIAELEGEKQNLEAIIYGRPGPDGQLPGYRGSGSGEAQRSLREVNKMLRDQAPEPLTGAEKDKLYKLEKELREKVTYGMLSAETMRKCPATAVDQHMRWEAANQPDVMRWKNARLQLAGKDAGRDEANLEQYRPEHSGHRIMTDGIIPGLHTMSEKAKENWPLGEPTIDTAEKQVARARKEMSEADKEKARTNLAKARKRKAELAIPDVVTEG